MLSRGAQVLLQSLERNHLVQGNPDLAKVLGATIYFQEDQNRMAQDSIDNLLTQTMSLGLEAIVNQHVIREKAHLLRWEIMKAVQNAAAAKAQLSTTNDHIIKLEDRAKSCEERIVELEQELEDARACRSVDLTQLTEEIKTKEEEALAREAGAYVNAHSDLLAELVKRYPKEDFS